MAEELSPGGGVSREHGVAELTHLRVQRDAGHQHPAGLAQHLTGQERRCPQTLWHTEPLTLSMWNRSIAPLYSGSAAV